MQVNYTKKAFVTLTQLIKFIEASNTKGGRAAMVKSLRIIFGEETFETGGSPPL